MSDTKTSKKFASCEWKDDLTIRSFWREFTTICGMFTIVDNKVSNLDYVIEFPYNPELTVGEIVTVSATYIGGEDFPTRYLTRAEVTALFQRQDSDHWICVLSMVDMIAANPILSKG